MQGKFWQIYCWDEEEAEIGVEKEGIIVEKEKAERVKIKKVKGITVEQTKISSKSWKHHYSWGEKSSWSGSCLKWRSEERVG